MNQFNAIGRLVRDPETRAIGGGQNVSALQVAVNRSWKDKQSGDWKEETLFIRCNAWGKLADKAATLAKGGLVVIAGHLESRKWTDKDGGSRESIEVRLSTLESVNATQGGAKSDDWKNKGKKSGPAESFSQDLDDEIPF
jgi:single-strand DNA-binding protein